MLAHWAQQGTSILLLVAGYWLVRMMLLRGVLGSDEGNIGIGSPEGLEVPVECSGAESEANLKLLTILCDRFALAFPMKRDSTRDFRCPIRDSTHAVMV